MKISNGKTKKTLASIIVLLLISLYLINFAYAQVAARENARELAFNYALFSGKFYDLKEEEEKIEFEFYNGTYSICENERKAIPILVVNKDANTNNKYSFEAVGASWISLNVKEFLLPKRQSGVVFLDLRPGKNTNGRYSIKISGESSVGNVKKELSIDVNVEKCYSLSLEFEKEEDKVCGGIKKEYIGSIINDGKQKIDVELNAKGPNWIGVDKNVFSIASNEKQQFEVSADVPANAKGVFNVAASAVAGNLPSISSEKNLRIEVVPKYDCYKADFVADAKITNHYSNDYIPIKIRNDGVKQAVYDIGIEAPGWISIEPRKLSINPRQTGNLNLNINPSAGVPEGTYSLKINAKLEDIVYTKNIDVVLSRNQLLKWLKLFFIFYQYYIYVVLLIAVLLLIFRRKISNKIRTAYKNYKVRKARLKALEAARRAKQEKREPKEIKAIKKAKFEIKKINKYRIRWLLFLAGLIVIISILSIFVKDYYFYFIAGVLISVLIIFMIEFYKPLFKLLKEINKRKK